MNGDSLNFKMVSHLKFTSHVRASIAAVGLLCNKFIGHSFRIGAATAASRVGIEDSKIRQLGC